MIAVRHRGAALLLTGALTALTAVLLPAPAHAEVDGIDLKVTKAPDNFEAGDDPQIVEVVVSTDNRGRCRKIRFSMVLGVEGAELDQVRVNRVEENGTFPTQVRDEGGKARITDTQVDPGQLCRGRTVTARYEVSVAENAPDGRITFDAEAFDAGRTLLQKAAASSDIEGVAKPSTPPSEAPEEPAEEESSEAAIPPPADASGISADLAAGQDSTPSLLGPGLIVGAVLVLIGVGLLMRLRLRNRNRNRPQRPQMPGYARY
ncbi:hypothetical protein [Actinoplanes sp. NBRC 103695]|uniref:hypothetical protein n=1 Tax=Actinoplanes sp. NBRC 103695 TaxID=3032202 RepID=UPI0025546965|nr:hypothetical protein [Actinoplanes sp. NBRC 103695]